MAASACPGEKGAPLAGGAAECKYAKSCSAATTAITDAVTIVARVRQRIARTKKRGKKKTLNGPDKPNTITPAISRAHSPGVAGGREHAIKRSTTAPNHWALVTLNAISSMFGT